MAPWEKALNHFLMDWNDRKEVVGALVCGSYITGNPTQRSDIDIHIILADTVDWRERGNQIIDGLLIEYFANPSNQIRRYFKEDYNNRSTMAMVQFITGKIIFDKTGIVNKLKQEAVEWKSKAYDKLPDPMKEIKKYRLWDACDNLLDCYEENRRDFCFVYYNSLLTLFNVYCALLNIEEIPYYQISQYLSDPAYLDKYLKQSFPDQTFRELFLDAIGAVERTEMLNYYKKLTEHIFERTGGFKIEGWHVRSKLNS